MKTRDASPRVGAGQDAGYAEFCSMALVFDRARGYSLKWIMNLDINQFICEIKSREAIWNINCIEYSDRLQKEKLWEEIINIFTDQDASYEERKYQGQLLHKRWRTLRDAFVKQTRELANQNESDNNKKLYKFYNQLLFLLPAIGMNTTQYSIETEDDIDDNTVERPHVSMTAPPEAKRARKVLSNKKIGRKLVHISKPRSEQKTEQEDPDRQFMLSLVSDFKTVPQRLKSRVKMNILKCIMEAQEVKEDDDLE